jgi:hypothetical protein
MSGEQQAASLEKERDGTRNQRRRFSCFRPALRYPLERYFLAGVILPAHENTQRAFLAAHDAAPL